MAHIMYVKCQVRDAKDKPSLLIKTKCEIRKCI